MTTQTEVAPAGGAVAKMSVPTLTAMVVGGMVGAGVFSLPARFGVATGILGSLIAWAIAGTGMLMLAFVFQALAIRKPELDSGVFIYAKAGFGDYAGFNSAIGFWASSIAGNCFYWVFIGATLGAFFDSFGDGDTVLAVAVSTAGVWLFHYLIARGVRDAAVINRIVTIFKVIPILVFIVVMFLYFDAGVFADNWTAYGYGDLGNLNEQVRNTMLITTFVFIGIEGASVYSRYARKREDVAGRPCSASCPCSRYSPWSLCRATRSCRSPSSPTPGSPRWWACSSRRWVTGARSSSALRSSCRSSAPTLRGR